MSYRDEQRERDRLDPRGPEMVELLRSKWTRGAIAALYGLSEARVKDLLAVHMPADERWAIYRAECAAEKAERRSPRRLAELLRRCAEAKPCVVCRAWVLRGPKRLTCSPACAKAWTVARYQLDDEQHDRHRLCVARVYLRSPEKYSERHLAWARRMLSDDPPPPNRRYVMPGSRAAEVVDAVVAAS